VTTVAPVEHLDEGNGSHQQRLAEIGEIAREPKGHFERHQRGQPFPREDRPGESSSQQEDECQV